MKLTELIDELEDISKESAEVGVAFRHAGRMMRAIEACKPLLQALVGSHLDDDMLPKEPPLSDTKVQEYAATLQVALDKDSPFKGMVDLSDLGHLPASHGKQVWDALDPAYQLLYEEMVKEMKHKQLCKEELG